MEPYFKDEFSALYHADSFNLLKNFRQSILTSFLLIRLIFCQMEDFLVAAAKEFLSIKGTGIKFLPLKKSTNLTGAG